MAESELLPCPWGHPAEVYSIGAPGLDPEAWGVSCSVSDCPVFTNRQCETRAEAVTDWNALMSEARAPIPGPAPEVQAALDDAGEWAERAALARSRALEEAAAMCERLLECSDGENEPGPDACAVAIRLLKPRRRESAYIIQRATPCPKCLSTSAMLAGLVGEGQQVTCFKCNHLLATIPARALRPAAPSSQDQGLVGLVEAMAKNLEARIRDCADCAALEGHCGGCYEAHALLEQAAGAITRAREMGGG